MTRDAEQYERVFKTAWFSKAAKKAHISDVELCSAMHQVMLGQADDLGGGVYKKRLHKNQYRSILVAGIGFTHTSSPSRINRISMIYSLLSFACLLHCSSRRRIRRSQSICKSKK